MKKDKPSISMFDTLWRLATYVKPHKGKFLVAYCFMILLAITGAVYAFLAGPALRFILTGNIGGLFRDAGGNLRGFWSYIPATIMDTIESFNREDALLILPVLIVVTALIKGISQAGQFHLMGVIAQKILLRMRTSLFDQLLKLPPVFYVKQTQGDLVARLINDSHIVEQSIFYGYAPLLRDTLSVAALLGFCFWLDAELALFTFIVIPVASFPIVRFTRWLKKVSSRGQIALSNMSSIGVEAINGIRVVQAFSMESYESNKFMQAAKNFLKEMKISYFIRAARTPIMEILGAAGLAGLLVWVGKSLVKGDIDPSHFISFFVAILMMYDPLKKLGRVGEYLATGAASAERIFEVLDAPVTITTPHHPVAWNTFKSDINFNQISFRYLDEPVLKNVSFTVNKGQAVAIVGRSGSGKTTLVNLLPRFYDVIDGNISIDNQDIRQVDLTTLRNHIAIVTQDTILFNDTVANNIKYGNPQASISDVYTAAHAAYADEFITKLPNGYDTIIGEQGVILSGGQKQRLAIARALIKDAPILILDEATSALDTESEQMVQKAIENLMMGRTSIVIAHRLSTIHHVDVIYVLEAGKVIEQGNHTELLKQDGEYARLYNMQFADQAD